MADRAKTGKKPWDEDCVVTTYVGGRDAMSAMRDALRLARDEASALPQGTPRAQYGHVYITGWRFNCLRDLSTANQWGTDDWDSYLTGRQANEDDTALGLVLQLMQAGVVVRILVWYPRAITYSILSSHIADHFYLAKVVAKENARLKALWNETVDIGVVALDVRTTDPVITAAHHQKTMVIRGAATSVAYVGGVDLAFTRRDAPPLEGDWQSGEHIPDPALGWPKATAGVDYDSVTPPNGVPPFTDRMGSDLPEEIFGDGDPGTRQMWHDQHLQLKGSIVKTLEYQFVERWQDTTSERLIAVTDPAADSMWSVGQVVFSSPNAFDTTGVKDLSTPTDPPAEAGATSLVQMWRTIPLRTSRAGKRFTRAEFTAMAGLSRAVMQATQLIWMFDQYFWSRPLARLLNARLKAVPSLHVIVILPPHADSFVASAHHARALALDDLTAGLTKTAGEYDRVAVYNLWYDADSLPGSPVNRGIYVHAKSHTYDGDLLVCGSANLNRRSFLCDSEIACAVLDQAVVLAHQSALWSYLFDGAQRPNVNLNGTAADRGKQFFDAFRQSIRTETSVLIPDPWQDADPELPNGRKRDQSPFLPFSIVYPYFLDPSSITARVEEQKVFDVGLAKFREPQLDEIVERLEKTHVGTYWPYRRP
jgi:phosphatidylserine/phosphatidylglycerophosphate/cardiolipin synthase-like enzyme